MTLQATLAQLIDVLGATALHCSDALRSQTTLGLTTDTRELQPGQLFLALRGDQFDGHRFVEGAIAAGAMAAIVDQPLDAPVPQVIVPNTLRAYQQLGRWWRDQFQIPIIGITGSVGKTTTKEMIAAALATAGSVLKTEANFNNEIGVPKTLLNLNPTHDFAVIEMGMRASGEIEELTHIAQPTIGVITNVGTAHIERLGSREAIARAKCELLATMPKTSLALLNAENPLLLATAEAVWQGATLTYGLTTGDLRGTLIDGATLEVEGVSYPLPLPGEHNALNLLAVIAILRALKLDETPLRQGLTVHLPDGRAQQYRLPQDIMLLDESYNAGAESMAAVLKLLAQMPAQRRIAVLGPMLELGDFAEELHRQVGKQVQALHLDALYLLGNGAEVMAIAQGVTTVPTQVFTQPDALVKQLVATLQPGDRVLFKASHAVGLDRVVRDLKARLSP